MKPHRALFDPRLLVLGLALLAATSCAVDGGAPGTDPSLPPTHAPQDAARQGLPPAYRPFYDELQDYGDWVLVEPHGWVFRPRVNSVAWRPYEDGHWEASYAFGWVWVSNEPFGWITDHYGFWFRDDFQGWVWQPYGAWAPSWVAWVQVGNFVGWAPLAPEGTPISDQVPDGMFTYMPISALAQQTAAANASYVDQVPEEGELRPIERVASYRGVHWNAGPDPALVLGVAAADRLRMDEREHAVAPPAPPRAFPSDVRPIELPALADRTRRAWAAARRELAQSRAARGVARPSRPAAPAPAPQIRPHPAESPPADSLYHAPGDSLLRRLRQRLGRRGRPGSPTPPNG